MTNTPTHQSWDERSDGVWVGRLRRPKLYAALRKHLARLEGERVLLVAGDDTVAGHNLYDAAKDSLRGGTGLAAEWDACAFYSYLSALNWLEVQHSDADQAPAVSPDEDEKQRFWFSWLHFTIPPAYSISGEYCADQVGYDDPHYWTHPLPKIRVAEEEQMLWSRLANLTKSSGLPSEGNRIAAELRVLWLSGETPG